MASEVDFPEVYTTVPQPVSERRVGQLSQDQIEQFFNEGYVIVENYFTPEELEPCKRASEKLVDDVANKLYDSGKIQSKYEEYDLFHRLIHIEREWPGAAILMFKDGTLPQAFMDLWCCDKFINMGEQILGPDVATHPVWNLRVKPPHNSFNPVPWHQDSGYFNEESYDHMTLIAWIPFLDTDAHNGGMQVVKNGHRKGHCAKHTCCYGDTWYIVLEEDEMEKSLGSKFPDDVVTCKVPFGGFLLFNNMTPHRSLPNTSDNVRWSIDLRWQSPKEKWGFYDIAEGVVLKTADQGIVKPDWPKFLKVNRKKVWQDKYNKEDEKSDPFDLTVTGPWIGRWDIVNNNRHTDAFRKITEQ